MENPTKEQLKLWRKSKHTRKVGQLEKLANRRSIKRRSKVELLKLVSTLSRL